MAASPPGAGSDTVGLWLSIVIPTYRRAGLLRQALHSALNQSEPTGYEIVVVDNDPDPTQREAEGLVSLLGDARIAYHRNASNLGMVGNWNRGLRLARGEWVTVLPDDDMLRTDYVRVLGSAVAQFPGLRAVAVCCSHIDSQGRVIRYHPDPGRAHRRAGRRAIRLRAMDFWGGNPLTAVGVAFRRADGLRLGFFRETRYPSMDFDLWLRLAMGGGFWLVRDVLATFRVAVNESFREETRRLFDTRDREILREELSPLVYRGVSLPILRVSRSVPAQRRRPRGRLPACGGFLRRGRDRLVRFCYVRAIRLLWSLRSGLWIAERESGDRTRR
jgi:glycosyltransferase